MTILIGFITLCVWLWALVCVRNAHDYGNLVTLGWAIVFYPGVALATTIVLWLSYGTVLYWLS